MSWHLPAVASLAAAMILATACGAGGPAATKPGRLPAAHHVHALRAADEGRLLLGLHGGLWRSEDAGTSWQQAGLDGQDAMAIGSAPDVAGPLLIGGHGLLARAEDPTGQPAALAATSQGRIWIVTEEPRTLQRSTDDGHSWQEVARA